MQINILGRRSGSMVVIKKNCKTTKEALETCQKAYDEGIQHLYVIEGSRTVLLLDLFNKTYLKV